MGDLEEIAGRRQMEKFDPRVEQFSTRDTRPGFKNFAGSMLADQMVPALGKIAGSYWKTQDDRAALRARVQAP